MISEYCKDKRKVEELRSSLVGTELDAFSSWLGERGYCRSYISRMLCEVGHFSKWAKTNQHVLENIDDRVLGEYKGFLNEKGGLRYANGNPVHVFRSANHFVNFLTMSRHGITAQDQKSPSIIMDFRTWMRSHRGVKDSTLNHYCPLILGLYDKLDGKLEDLNVKRLREFILERATGFSKSHVKSLAASVRMFIRYLVVIGKCHADLEYAIPKIAHWRLSSLPKFLGSKEIDHIIDLCDPSTPAGARDRAIILLLARLGLRAGDVSNMRLENLDWEEGTFVVAGKSRRMSRLPLPQDVGEAILCYLEKARPKVNSQAVFITLKAPFIPISRQQFPDRCQTVGREGCYRTGFAGF